MINFAEKVPTADIVGAEYNPRVITEEAFEALQHSIRRFGMVKPLIINSSTNTIVAGHQRQKAATAIGMEYLPCIKISTPKIQDEIQFNLLHNSVETSQNVISLGVYKVGQYIYCPSKEIKVESQPKNILICSNIIRLLSQYGEWGSVVTDGDGNIILNSEYAYCAKKMGFGVLSYAVPNEDVDEFLKCVDAEYGEYCYDNLGIKTYHQFLAQLKRRSADGRRQYVSPLYENYIIPRVQKTDHIIDVGAGRMAYEKLLKSQGYDIHAYEPSLITKGSNSLDMKGIVANILDAEKTVKAKGLFYYCILEYVINSVIDDEFEKAVLTLCNATLKSTGTLLTCTRNIEEVISSHDLNTLSTKSRKLRCLDKNNYSISITTGIAFKQKYHSKDSYTKLLGKFFEKVEVMECTPSTIYCACTKPKQLGREVYEEYLEKELNIEYPNGFKHNKHKGLMNALIEKVDERYG